MGRPRLIQVGPNKICSTCKVAKPLGAFRNHSGPDSRLRAACGECDNKRGRDRRHKNPEKYRVLVRLSHLKTKYGLSKDSYDAKLLAQGNVCAICLSPNSGGPFNRAFCVDHDHNSGAVRGLLCQFCNQGIGLFRENKTNLRNAIAYLEKYVND